MFVYYFIKYNISYIIPLCITIYDYYIYNCIIYFYLYYVRYSVYCYSYKYTCVL